MAAPRDAGTSDSIVIGAGSAGGALASRLSAYPRRRMLWEAGGSANRMHVLTRRGPLAMAPSLIGKVTGSSPDHVQPLSLDVFGQPLHRFAALTVSVCTLRPQSRRSSHIRSADLLAEPAIRPNCLSDPADRRAAVESMRHARQVMATRYAPTEILPGPGVTSDADPGRAAGNISTRIFHPAATARVGRDPAAVVSDRFRVHGLAGLSIADASVMPAIPGGNTHAPVTMTAEKAAAMILERSVG